MKQLTLIIILCTVYLGCKKSHDYTLPPKYPDNNLKATISVDGGSPFVLSATGDFTMFVTFVDSSSGEKVSTVLGSNENSQVQIEFINIPAKGTYSFGSSNGPGSVYAFCDYIVGNPFAPSALYSTSFNGGSGTVTIDSLSSQYISGTFSATCVSGNINAQITSGSFKGNF